MVRHTASFEPTEHVTLRKIIGGSVEVMSPPADIEAIHAPT